MQARRPSPRVFEFTRFHGYGMEAPLSMLEEYLWRAEAVELFPSERIAFLNIRFGELFHRCTEQEWGNFRRLLTDNGFTILTRRWWHAFTGGRIELCVQADRRGWPSHFPYRFRRRRLNTALDSTNRTPHAQHS